MPKTKFQFDANNNEIPPVKRRKGNICDIISVSHSSETQLSNSKVKEKSQCQSSWAYLPVEVLVKIFEYVVETEMSAFPGLLQFSKVCSHWKMASQIPFLWKHIRFAPFLIKNERTFKSNVKSFELMASAHFHSVETLLCSGLALIAPIVIRNVALHARKMKKLSVQRCGPISARTCLQVILDRHLPSLEHLCIYYTTISTMDMRKILLGAGDALTHLEFINPELPRNIQMPLNHLKNLAVIKVECGYSFKISHIKQLSLLKVLHLTNMELDSRGCMEVDWPHLEDLDISHNNLCFSKQSDNRMLARMVCKSTNIRRINFRNRTMDVYYLIDSLRDCRKVEFLDISGFYGSDLSTLLLLLSGSLKELHLDHFASLNSNLYSCLNSLYWQSVIVLSLSHTDISTDCLRALLESPYANIQQLNLDRCRCLPRGCRRVWKDIQFIKDRLMRSVKE